MDVKSSGFLVICLPDLIPAFLFSPFSGLLKFSVSFLEDIFFPSFDLVFRSDIPDCAVKADIVVVVDELRDQAFGVID